MSVGTPISWEGIPLQREASDQLKTTPLSFTVKLGHTLPRNSKLTHENLKLCSLRFEHCRQNFK